MDWKSGVVTSGMRNASGRLSLFWGVAGAIVLGALLARWTWVLFGPREVAAVAVPAQYSATDAGNLFGAIAASGANVSSAALPDVKLAGVFDGVPGFAILVLDGGKQVGVALGGEIANGVKLLEIAADHVIIGNGSMRQSVELENVASGNKLAEAALAQPGQSQDAAPASPVAQQADPASSATADDVRMVQQGLLHHRMGGGFAR